MVASSHQSTTVSETEPQEGLEDTYKGSVARTFKDNQLVITRSILTAIYAAHLLVPLWRAYTSKFIHLQYLQGFNASGEAVFGVGRDDAYFVVHWLVMLTFLRSFIMLLILEPFASSVCKIYSKKAKLRFAEQGWLMVYYCCSFGYGWYVYQKSPHYLNLDKLYLDWPNHEILAAFKRYYLITTAFSLLLVYVLHVEEPRKDHYQMLTHHIITCCLIIGSYHYDFLRVGNVILMVMDSVDIFLPLAKMLRYSGYTTACDAMFLLFLVSWVVLRHGVYNVILYHTWQHFGPLADDARCVPGQVHGRCWNDTIINTFLALLAGLQVIALVWMYMIFKVAYRVVTGSGAEDVRSDEEDTDNEEEEEEANEKENDSERSTDRSD